jgi:hypothetical protein
MASRTSLRRQFEEVLHGYRRTVLQYFFSSTLRIRSASCTDYIEDLEFIKGQAGDVDFALVREHYTQLLKFTIEKAATEQIR